MGANRMEERLSGYVRLLLTIFEGKGVIDILGLKDVVDEVLLTLSPTERQFLTLRFGLSNGSILTSEEVATSLNTTRTRVDKHVSKALRKLRHPSRSKKLIPFIRATVSTKVEQEELVVDNSDVERFKKAALCINSISWRGQQWNAGESVDCPYSHSGKPQPLVCWEHMYVYRRWLEGQRRTFGLGGAYGP